MGGMSTMLSPKKLRMVGCHPADPRARITVLLRWGRGEGGGVVTHHHPGGGGGPGGGRHGGDEYYAEPKRFGIVRCHPVVPTAETTDPSRMGGREGEGEGGEGTGGQEPENKFKFNPLYPSYLANMPNTPPY